MLERRLISGVAGIFVGGAGTRMGGVAKGLLRTAGGATLIERWRVALEPIGLELILVGSRPEYEALSIETVSDEPPGIGPLGGLVALLGRAGTACALALACDMPFVSTAFVARLLAASPGAPVVAPRRDGRWEPLCARYDPARVLAPARAAARSSHHSLQALLARVGAVELPLAPREEEELRDWDSPEDV